MRKLMLVTLGLCAAWAVPGITQSATPGTQHTLLAVSHKRSIRIHFVDTDVTDVLQALSLKTHSNIVFPAQIKKPISINLVASDIDEALNYVTGAAGLAYRKIGSAYVVAVASELRQALQAFGTPMRIPLTALSSEEAVKFLDSALPYLTARSAGSQAVFVSGASEDIDQARSLLEAQQQSQLSDPQVHESVVLQHVVPTQVTAMLQTVFPLLKAEVVGSAGTDKVGGTIILAGPRSEVKAACDAIQGADVSTTPQAPERVFRVYNIKYSSAPLLKAVLKDAAPTVTVVVGPAAYTPPSPGYNPISAVSLGTSGSSGGSSGGGGGASGGGASGGGASGGGASGGGGGASGGDTAGGGAAGGTSSRQGDKSKTLVLAGTLADLDSAFHLLDQVDIPPRQVIVDVKVVDVSMDAEQQLGVTYSWQSFNAVEQPPGSTNTTTTATTRPLGLGHFSRLPWGMQATINALGTRNDSKILADPRIQVLDNDDASIFIGNTIRSTVSQSGISGTTLQIVEIPVGIILLVNPRINADGKITMHVHPVVSTVTSITNGLPQTSSREAETTVMVQDGETMVIGGLIDDETTKSVQEIPLLSRLPLVGELFRNRSTSKIKSEVLVFITPHLVK